MTTTNRILSLVAPPLSLISWLETIFDLKRKKGEKIPLVYTDWLDLVKCIRTDLPSELDTMVASDWQEASEIVGRYVTMTDDAPVQPALLNVPRKMAY